MLVWSSDRSITSRSSDIRLQRMEMKVSLLFFSFLVLFISLTSSSVSSQSDSCSTKLNAAGLGIPFSTSSLKCFSAWTSEGFILRYVQAGPKLWSYVISAPDTGGYVAIGFSSSGGMIGASAVAGWASSSGGTAKQYSLGGYSSSQCPPDKGSLPLVQNSTVVVSQASRLYLAFQLETANPITSLIYAVGPKNTRPSSGGYLSTHRNMASGSINSSGGGSGGSRGGDDDDGGGDGGKHRGEGDGENKKTEGDQQEQGEGASKVSAGGGGGLLGISRKKQHGLLTMVGWGILMPLGLVAARYLKLTHDTFWFFSHISLQAVGFVLGAVGVLAGFKLEDSSDIVGGRNYGVHVLVGVVVLVLGCLQVMAILARPSKESKSRKYWNWYHHNVGRAAIVCAIANVFYGLVLAKESRAWSYVYGTFLGIWLVVCLVLEEWRRKKMAL